MKKSLFGKIFITIFVTIFIVMALFIYQAIVLQKNVILQDLKSKAKNVSDVITLANSEAMIIDDEVSILEFLQDYVKKDENIKSFSISRNAGNTLIITKEKWTLLELIVKDSSGNSELDSYSIRNSEIVNEEVFKYTYPIYFSKIKWGWFIIELSLKEYDKKVLDMYKQFSIFVLLIIIASFLISYFIARMISKPIIELNRISNDIANGDLSRRVNIYSDDEIGKLAKSFNKMVVNLESSRSKLRRSHVELENRVALRTKELNDLNETLEERVSSEIKKQQEQEQLLIQQSKLASMGEMIGNIAHQWRQPLNALGLVMQNIYFSYEMDELTDEFMEKSVKKVNLLTDNMSKTIDDFRNFFKPNKGSEVFNLNGLVKDTLGLVDATFQHQDVKIRGFHDGEILVYGFPSEFSQTLLNVLNNAKDALLDNKINDAEVYINVGLDDNYGFVKVKDNAGGIPADILDKIFDPYFTTKDEGKGTGIGLYMSKIIVEQNMNGKLIVNNISNGAEFIIKIPLYKELV